MALIVHALSAAVVAGRISNLEGMFAQLLGKAAELSAPTPPPTQRPTVLMEPTPRPTVLEPEAITAILAGPALEPETDNTVDGCKCTSKCSPTVDDGYACDWCNVPAGCGKSSWVNGQWDYCVYDEMKDWEAQDHKTKMDTIWKDMTAPDVIGKSAPVKDPLSVVHQMVTESMRTTMDMHRDVLPKGRSKVIHAQGVHCKFDLKIDNSPYTGIFSAGTKAGIIRMGSGTSLKQDIFPGIGVKFFRSGVHSANFVALRATGPGGSMDFFNGDISNHVAPPPELQALMKFQQASNCISMVGLSDVCTYDQNGAKATRPNFPFELLFRAVDFRIPESKHTDEELLKELSRIPTGTHLYDVYAKASPKATPQKFGELRTTSACVQSLFGDNKLAFKHQRMEADFQQRPQWMPDVSFTACNPSAEDLSKWQCPFVKSQQ